MTERAEIDALVARFGADGWTASAAYGRGVVRVLVPLKDVADGIISTVDNRFDRLRELTGDVCEAVSWIGLNRELTSDGGRPALALEFGLRVDPDDFAEYSPDDRDDHPGPDGIEVPV